MFADVCCVCPDFIAGKCEGAAECGGGGAMGLQNEPPRGRGGAQVRQDFRYSRFQIEQAFAEGFDPDRIAVAFAQDLSRVGERQLQSNVEPIGGTV